MKVRVLNVRTHVRPTVTEGILVRDSTTPRSLYMFCQIAPNQYKLIGMGGNRETDKVYKFGDRIESHYEIVTHATVEFGAEEM